MIDIDQIVVLIIIAMVVGVCGFGFHGCNESWRIEEQLNKDIQLDRSAKALEAFKLWRQPK